MANRKALSSSRQAMNAVQPISTYEGFGTIISVLVTKLLKPLIQFVLIQNIEVYR